MQNQFVATPKMILVTIFAEWETDGKVLWLRESAGEVIDMIESANEKPVTR